MHVVKITMGTSSLIFLVFSKEIGRFLSEDASDANRFKIPTEISSELGAS